jgi:PBP1b-binding outer membrane lipoprotein LpoB
MVRILSIICFLALFLSGCSSTDEEMSKVSRSSTPEDVIDIKAQASDVGSDFVDVNPVDVSPVSSDFKAETTNSNTHSVPAPLAQDGRGYHPKGVFSNKNVQVFPLD